MQPLETRRRRLASGLIRLEESYMSIEWRDDADAALGEADERGVAALLDFNAAPD